MHKRYLVERKSQENSAYDKRSETKHDRSLSGWCSHGIHL